MSPSRTKASSRSSSGPLRVLPGRRVGKEPIDRDLLELAVRVLVEAAHPDIADAVTVYGGLLPLVCQDELCNPGHDVSTNPNGSSHKCVHDSAPAGRPRRGKRVRMRSCQLTSGAVVCRSVDGRLRGPRF